MVKRIDTINLFSEDSSKLAEFYREIVGLKQSGEFIMGEGEDPNAYMFDMGGGLTFAVLDHSEVTGKNPNPQRVMVNFEVEDIGETLAELKENMVKVVADKYHIEGYGWVATLEDPDGNYFQIVQVRAL